MLGFLPRRRRGSLGLVGLLVLLTATPALAQDPPVASFDLQRFDPAVGSSTFVLVEEGRVASRGGVSVDFLGGYAHELLQASNADLARQASLVEGLVSMHLRGAWAFAKWGEVAVSAPVLQVALVGGELPDHRELGPAASFGDLKIAGRFAPLDDERILGLGLSVFLTVPTGRSELLLSAGVPTVGARLAVSRRFGPLRVAGQVGYRFVPEGRALDSGVAADDRLDFGGAVGLTIPTTPVDVGAEVVGSTVVGPSISEAVSPHAAQLNTPAELLVSTRIELPAGFSIRVAGGPGLTAAPGTPTFRVVGGVSWTPSFDPDGDGVFGLNDRCPKDAEDLDGVDDHDGCPDGDDDNDGVANEDDRCPRTPEDRDGWEDEDGCPDPDDDGDSLLDADDRCPREAEDVDGFEDADGCPDLDDDGDGVPDTDDLCPRQQETKDGVKDEDGCPDNLLIVRKGDRIHTLEPVVFASGGVDFKSTAPLHAISEMLQGDPTITLLRIEGHVAFAPAGERQSLSERRAVAVMRWLAEDDVDFGRLEAVGRGDTDLDERNPADRIEFRIVSP